MIQNNWRINNFFSSGKTLFSIFFKPLINFQEINIYRKKEKHEKIHYLFFRSFSGSYLLSGKITRWCNFTRNFKPLKFIKIHSNQLLKLNKTFLYASIHFGPACRNSNRPINNIVRPSLPQQPTLARCPHPGRNLGLGRQSRAAARARLGRPTVQSISAAHSDPTVVCASRTIKTATAAAPIKP